MESRRLLDKVDDAKVGGVPDAVTPQLRLETGPKWHNALLRHDLLCRVPGGLVHAQILLRLHAHLHQFERTVHERLSHFMNTGRIAPYKEQ